jgi:hypothetical protein
MVFVTKMHTPSLWRHLMILNNLSKRSRERIYTVRYAKYPQPRLTTVCYLMEKTPDTNNSHRKHISSSAAAHWRTQNSQQLLPPLCNCPLAQLEPNIWPIIRTNKMILQLELKLPPPPFRPIRRSSPNALQFALRCRKIEIPHGLCKHDADLHIRHRPSRTSPGAQ